MRDAPTWTDGAHACGTCHGLPPAGTHPASGTAACSNCHPAGYDATAGKVAAATHVNGAVDLPNLSCTSCHGGTLTGADAAGVGAQGLALPERTPRGRRSGSRGGRSSRHAPSEAWCRTRPRP